MVLCHIIYSYKLRDEVATPTARSEGSRRRSRQVRVQECPCHESVRVSEVEGELSSRGVRGGLLGILLVVVVVVVVEETW
jgi:hypothetical protein